MTWCWVSTGNLLFVKCKFVNVIQIQCLFGKIESLKSRLPRNQVDQAQNDNRQKLAGSPMLPRLVINLASMTPTTLSPFISNQDSGIWYFRSFFEKWFSKVMERPMLNVVTKFWMSKILEKVKDWAIRPGQGWLREGGRTIDSLFTGRETCHRWWETVKLKFEEKSDLGKLQIYERKDFLAPSKGCVGRKDL